MSEPEFQEELELIIREAVPEDAVRLGRLMKKLGKETDFLIIDQSGAQMQKEQLQMELQALYESDCNVLLVAQYGEKLVGIANVRAENDYRIAHIGDIGIAVLREYWGMGLGSYLLEELVAWACAAQLFRRLELRVQCRNERAVALYEKFGFAKEARLADGARLEDGSFVDVYQMSLLLKNTKRDQPF